MIASFFEIALGWIHKQHLVTISMAGAFLVNLVLNMLLIPRYTITGAAWATCAAFFVHLLFMIFLVCRFKLIKVNMVFPCLITALSGLMGCGVYGVSLLIPRDGWVPLLLLPFTGLLIYGTLLFFFKILSPSLVRKTIDRLFPGDKVISPAAEPDYL